MTLSINRQINIDLQRIGITKDDYSKRANLNKDELDNILEGKGSPTVSQFLNICEASECPAFFMLSYDTQKAYPFGNVGVYRTIERKDIKSIIRLISTRSFVIDGNNVHLVSPKGKLYEAMDETHLKMLYELLLNNGYIEYLKMFPRYQELLDLRYYEDITKFGNRTANLLLCDKGTTDFNPQDCYIPNISKETYNFISHLTKGSLPKAITHIHRFYDEFLSKVKGQISDSQFKLINSVVGQIYERIDVLRANRY